MSGNRSPKLRKRALRRLSHEQYAAGSALYEHVLPEIPGLTRHLARGRAPAPHRQQFPHRYPQLPAHEQAGTGTEVPPDTGSRCWQRANARLADRPDRRVQGRTAAAVTPAAGPSKLGAASARITELEAENARLRERVRALTALAVEMSPEAEGTATVIPLKRLTPAPHREKEST